MTPMLIEYADRLAAPIEVAGYRLLGLYLHGSSALGGFRPESSDVDVLAIVDGERPESQDMVGAGLRKAATPCPGIGLEMSVITACTARDLADCRFEVHVSTTPGDEQVVPGRGRADPDLTLHLAVTRAAGLRVRGPSPEDLIAPLDETLIATAIADELDWALDQAPQSYAVLNACRALRYAYRREFVSKVDAGQWFLDQRGSDAVVQRALHEQRAGVRTWPIPDDARRFVADARTVVRPT